MKATVISVSVNGETALIFTSPAVPDVGDYLLHMDVSRGATRRFRVVRRDWIHATHDLVLETGLACVLFCEVETV